MHKYELSCGLVPRLDQAPSSVSLSLCLSYAFGDNSRPHNHTYGCRLYIRWLLVRATPRVVCLRGGQYERGIVRGGPDAIGNEVKRNDF